MKIGTLKTVVGAFLAGVLIVIMSSVCVAGAKTNEMTDKTFSDVKANHWYYASVKSIYNNELMNGVGNNRFDPNGNTTLAQVITIAARLHAQYNNKTIEMATSGEWYVPYVKYATDANLLSDEISQIEDVNAGKASRAQTAYLFYKVLVDKEPSAKHINDSTVLDLNEVPEEYKEAATEMFGRGIITGITEGNFDGDLYVTRAQIATILNRVINVQERVPYDSKQNNELNEQAGNLQMHKRGTMVYNDDFTYFAVMLDLGEKRCDIVQRNNKTGESKVLYVGSGDLYNLRVEDDTLYFLEEIEGLYYTNLGGYKTLVKEHVYLVSYDLKTNCAKKVYETDKFETIYAFERYNNKFYLVGDRSGTYNCRVFEIDDYSNKRNLVSFNACDGISVDLYVYDDRVYLSYLVERQNGTELEYHDEISVYDLNDNKTSVLIDKNLKDVNFYGGMIYTAEDVDESATTAFYKYNLATGTAYDKDKVHLGTVNNLNYTIAMSVLNGNIYVSSDKANYIYKMLGDGSLEIAFKTNMLPLRYIITGKNECFYNIYWDGIFNTYFSMSDNTNNSIVKYLKIDKNGELHAEKSVATGSSKYWPSLDNVEITNDYKENKFSWKDQRNKSWWVDLFINDGLYREYKKVSRADHIIDYPCEDGVVSIHDYAFYCNSPDDDAYLHGVSNLFKSIQEDCGYSELELAQSVANFVQSIPYVTDKIGTGYDEYPKFPVEYLYEKSGDCEDSSILLASLYKQLGFECVLFHFEGHMAVGVACHGASGTYYEKDGVKYFYIETTSTGWEIGELPTAVKNLLLVYSVK